MKMSAFGAAAAVAASAILMPRAAVAAPIEYVRVCDAFGTGYQYIPGTETCVKVATGETRTDTKDGVVRDKTALAKRVDQAFEAIDDANEGAAVMSSLPVPFVEKNHNFALAGNFAQFESNGAFGLAGAFRVNSHLTFNGGVAVGADEGNVGGRVGFNLSW
ncbi:YadA C-terminal domain-containing protein [Kaistia granuli]|uniref:YadA C-terminal domain-containing protein n=1 Tax=Kaistia granuli TaxID=363259 RepID=UPI0012EC22D4|nr:YadA C-terminal domain-containing protein [Kaistia granuli]